MKAALLYEPGNIQIKETGIVSPKNNELLIKVKMAGICGSDFHRYTGDRPVRNYPIILGHEFTGVVVKVGEKVKKIKSGDRVVFNPYFPCGKCFFCISGNSNLCFDRISIGIDIPGCFAEYITVPESGAKLVPEHVSDQRAVLTEPLAVALRAIKKAGSLIGKKVAILGAGAIGLLILQLAKRSGAKVLLSDLVEEKLQLASELGADITVNVTQKNLFETIKSWSSGIGADVVIETAGVQKTVEQAINIIRPGGKVIIVGLSTEFAKVSPIHIARKEIKIEGTILYVEEFEEALNLVSDNDIGIERVISHIIDLSKISEALEIIEQNKGIKILLKMSS